MTVVGTFSAREEVRKRAAFYSDSLKGKVALET
jgi:hypothetical protein